VSAAIRSAWSPSLTLDRRDGQPVCFVCRRRSDHKTFFVVTFELEGEPKVGAKAAPAPAPAEEDAAKEEPVEDVDSLGVD
jgi:hypothetical protein